METETNAFIRYRRGRNIFAFRCPVCGTRGKLTVPDGNRNGLVPCPSKCGAQFMVRRGRGFFAKPTLEFAFGPGAARAEKQGGKMAKCEEWDPITSTLDGRVIWRRYGDHKIVVAGRDETPEARSEPEQRSRKNMSRTDHNELLKRAATFLGELLIDNRIDADQIAGAKALHDDLMAAVQRQPATPTCNKTWFVAGGRDERTCGEFAEPDQVCAECGAARCAEHNDISFEEVEGRILCEGCEADMEVRKP